MANIFISYSHHDKEIISLFIKGLSEVGHNVYSDFDLVAGTDWKDYILNALNNTDVHIPMIVFYLLAHIVQ